MNTMRFTATACLLLIAIAVNATEADDQTNFAFDKGSVIIHCAAPSEEQQLSEKVFQEAFGWWMTKLQTHAQEGRIARAHYLTKFKQGIFIVVLGSTPADAMENALAIQAENEQIMKDALEKTGGDASSVDFDDACQLIRIGPVAILPIK